MSYRKSTYQLYHLKQPHDQSAATIIVNDNMIKLSPNVTLKDMIMAKLGNIWVMGDEVIQEIGQLVALSQRHMAAYQVLVNHSQMEIVAEGVDVHQVSNLIALLSEEHGQLQQKDTFVSSFKATNRPHSFKNAQPLLFYENNQCKRSGLLFVKKFLVNLPLI